MEGVLFTSGLLGAIQCCHSFGYNPSNSDYCNRTDFPVFRLSSDFALARVYCVTVHFDLVIRAMAVSAASSSSRTGLQDNEQCEESDSSDSDGQSAPPSLIFS